MEARTEEVLRADPLVSEPLTRRRGARARSRRGHPPAADPDAVRGRPRQHLPDRGRPADAGRLGAELGHARSTSSSTSSPSTATRSTTSSWWCSRTSTSTTSAWWTSSSSPLRRRGGGDRQARALRRALLRGCRTDDEFAGGVMLRNGIPEEIVQALRTVSSAFRAWGARQRSPARCATATRSSCATARSQVLHRPGHSPSDTVFWDARAPDPDRGRPPDQAHLLQPADQPPAGRPDDATDPAPTGRRRSSPIWSRCARRASCRPRSCCPATASRSPTTSR